MMDSLFDPAAAERLRVIQLASARKAKAEAKLAKRVEAALERRLAAAAVFRPATCRTNSCTSHAAAVAYATPAAAGAARHAAAIRLAVGASATASVAAPCAAAAPASAPTQKCRKIACSSVATVVTIDSSDSDG